MGAFGYNHRLPGLVGDCLPGHAGANRRSENVFGKPRMVLDWNPNEADADYDGSFAGTDRVISGITTKVHNRVSDGGASSTDLLRCTTSGLKVTHKGGSGEPTMLQWDFSGLPGMSVAYRQRCISMSIVVDAFENGTTGAANTSMFFSQNAWTQPNLDATNMDISLQISRQSSTNWRARSFDWTSPSGSGKHWHTSQGAGSSEPSQFRLMMWGNSYMWWTAYDLNAGPCRFQEITNDRRIVLNNSVTAHANDGLNHNKILWQLGRGDDTPITLTLTNMRIWTY